MHHNASSTSSDHQNGACDTTKKKRRPAGTPDPDAEVVSLSPKTLLESDRYVCEICNQGFQRDQNLQMHRRRHKVPWQLLKRETTADQDYNKDKAKKKVYVCPEPSCLHHDPHHALGDLVGIKKHFRRKHSTHKQWVCDKCSKAYAVQSDYKAHLKTCGTRGHSCDCGRVFSRVESFIEHQDVCTVRHYNPDHFAADSLKPNSSRTASSSSASTEPNVNLSSTPLQPPPPPLQMFPMATNAALKTFFQNQYPSRSNYDQHNHLDLSIGLGLGMGMGSFGEICNYEDSPMEPSPLSSLSPSAAMLREYAKEQPRLTAAEKAFAEEARQQAMRQVEVAEVEFANAQRIRLQAQAELERAQVLKEQALRKLSSTITQITCPTCKLQFRYPLLSLQPSDESSLAMSYMSSATTDGDGQ